MLRYVLAAVLGLGLFGCVEQSAVADPVVAVQEELIVVPCAPPAPLAEVVVVRPGPGYVWIHGHHYWTGGAWVWTPGRWIVGRPGYRWVGPRYYWHRGHHVWVRGYWRR
ncbi:MAG TPA: hypothetical protein VM577_11540 [Anaerovoracaceae bacterium]|nr:hypothetical protein [Anaerovoracaceae bacterium]